MKKRYAIVGTGARAPMFIDPIFAAHKNDAELVAMCDTNPVRMDYHLACIRETAPDFSCPRYPAEDFGKMLRVEKPDVLLVCSPDFTHDRYLMRGVRHGCDVVCEKPITTDEKKARAILAAVQDAGRSVRVTFNYRWTPGTSAVKELLLGGIIGDIKHVSLNYLLNTRHGADYFRRWHADMKSSGGLLVHKSTHHFDLVNWWVDSIPETVFGQGSLAFYGRENALRRGDAKLAAYDRYTGTPCEDDPFRLDLNQNTCLKGLYLDAEKHDGYLRDRNVFRDGIDIYDTMAVQVKYRSGVVLSYSLNAFCPHEGFSVRIVGDRGVIEYNESHASHRVGQPASSEAEPPPPTLTVMPLFKEPYPVQLHWGEGGHGGGDPLLQEQIFSSNPPQDKLQRSAGYEQGIASAIIGIAANKSIRTGKPVKVSSLIELSPQAVRLSELV